MREEEEEGHKYLGHELLRFGCKGGGGGEQGVQLRGFPCIQWHTISANEIQNVAKQNRRTLKGGNEPLPYGEAPLLAAAAAGSDGANCATIGAGSGTIGACGDGDGGFAMKASPLP